MKFTTSALLVGAAVQLAFALPRDLEARTYDENGKRLPTEVGPDGQTSYIEPNGQTVGPNGPAPATNVDGSGDDVGAATSNIAGQGSETVTATQSGSGSVTATATASSSTSTASAGASVPLDAFATVTGNGITGKFTFHFLPNEGTAVAVQVTGLALNESTPAGTIYKYHIHTNALNSTGSCASALGHLDPLGVTDGIACSPALSQLCQEGDLSGKHGAINTTSGDFSATYTDAFLRFYPQPVSLLGRSIVIHGSNGTRLACGNIISTLDGTSDAAGVATNKTSNYQNDYPAQGPPAPTTTVTPFVGTSTVESIYAQITAPLPLIPVPSAALIAITTTNLATTLGGQATTLAGKPVAVVVSSQYVLASGTPLPTQALVAGVNGNTNGATGGSSSSSTSSGGGNGGANAATTTLGSMTWIPAAVGVFGLMLGGAVVVL